ncbi:hypothetical protein P691DRAFT_713033 [Macrolepiota fuliginosa MF-IS2]|uniref:Uncharacterized protein n=1 Tax=Macrolepiota fuliginosa MF-IS2 TaxID=1400762 RepID=A0A9P5X2X4_9AGAR|nr:hypothetical protein P691DRAFT_713033 [Macrolepiota fuliginosa MF-IS2]
MLSDSRFAEVIYTLRVADARFFETARTWRSEQRPTHYAKRRATRLNLVVDTDKAARLHISAVSQRPYPEIVQTYSPVAVNSNIYTTTTCWVTGPTANDLVNMNAALVHHIARNPQPLQECSHDRLMYPPSGYEAHPVVHRTQPDVPSGVRGDWDSDVRSVVSSNTSESSSTVITPEDGPSMPLKIRINFKRKSYEVEDDGSYVEKRPKYGRKNWIATLRQSDVRSRNI